MPMGRTHACANDAATRTTMPSVSRRAVPRRRCDGAGGVERRRVHAADPPKPGGAAAQRDRARGRAEAPDGRQRALCGQHADRARFLGGPRRARAGAIPDRGDPELRRFARGAGPRVRPEPGRPLRRARRGQHRDDRTCWRRSSMACSSSGSPLILVLGHSSCGAVDAAIKVREDQRGVARVTCPSSITAIKPAAIAAAKMAPNDVLNYAIADNVRRQVARLKAARADRAEGLPRQEDRHRRRRVRHRHRQGHARLGRAPSRAHGVAYRFANPRAHGGVGGDARVERR